MRPMSAGGMFGRGGPLAVRTLGAQLAIAVVAGTVLAAIIRPHDRWLMLSPGLVVGHLALWQLVSYAFITYFDPLSVIFGGLILWSLGGALEASWGRKRLLWFLFGTLFAAGLTTVLLSLVFPALRGFSFPGGSAMATIAWVAYGLSFGRAQTNFWGMPVTGNVLALLGAAFLLLNVIFVGLLPFVPAVIAVLFTVLYVKAGSPRLLVLRLRHWKLQRDLKGRSRHLNVVSGGRDDRRGSDRFLH